MAAQDQALKINVFQDIDYLSVSALCRMSRLCQDLEQWNNSPKTFWTAARESRFLV